MIVTAIAAMDRAGLIGDGLRMPWHLPSDLRRFRTLTLGKPIILGRRTFESLGKPLPGRLNIVVSRRADFRAEGCLVAGSVDHALAIAGNHLATTGGDEAMIIGGGAVYEATAPLWDRLHLTVIDATFPGDVFFPVGAVTTPPWCVVAEEFHPSDARDPHAHWFLTIDRDPGPTADRATPGP